MVILAVPAIAVAIVDWWSVRSDKRPVEQIAKPLVMIVLIIGVLVVDIDSTAVKLLVVGGLSGGLIGDVLLLPNINNFIGGLVAFLVGHVLYVAAFVVLDRNAAWLVAGVAAMLVFVPAGRTILGSVKTSRLFVPVLAYATVIGIMLVAGIGTGRPLIALGALLFVASDALLATDRFVDPRTDRRMWVHVLYHLGQISIVAGL